MHELHARPFPELRPGTSIAMVALVTETDAVGKLDELLAHYRAARPAPDASHHTVSLGAAVLKWERHSEFVSYTLIREGLAEPPFSSELHDYLPADWLDRAGQVVSSMLMRIEPGRERTVEPILRELEARFARESLAVSRLGENGSIAASDFRLDPNGHVRVALYADERLDPWQLGRTVQRLLELEVYKSMAMLSLPVARAAATEIAAMETRLTEVMGMLSAGREDDQAMLTALLGMSSEMQRLSAATGFRFSAATAYRSIVDQRLGALDERRVAGRQLLSDFMSRRFEPAMRTCQSTERRLAELSERATRASNLLSTRVNVAAEAQNQALLDSMNARAEQQLRLQETVEGLSVVAISYYAVSLLALALAPFAERVGVDKGWLSAGLAPLVFVTVLAVLRATRRKLTGRARR